MREMELNAKKISILDNTVNVEMSNDEIWFLKHFIKKYNPKKIVEVGISAGGNTVNLLRWKDKNAQLFSIDIATQWYQDNTKLSGFMADELNVKNNWKLYRGYDFLDVYEEIGDDIDFIIIDTVHYMPGEFLTFLAALPQLKDGCIVILHDIHLNMLRLFGNDFHEVDVLAHCTGLLFGGVSSDKKWSLKSELMSNIGAFVVDKSTRDNIKDIFHILCSSWHYFPSDLNLTKYSEYIYENYPIECYKLFNNCLKAQSNLFNINIYETSLVARVDILNSNNKENTVKILNVSDLVDVDFPNWFKTDEGKGAFIQTSEKSFNIKFKCIHDGLLKILFRGPHVRDKVGMCIPSYVDFTTLRVNKEDIIENNVVVWHNDPYVFEKDVKDGEIIDLYVEWTFFNYSNFLENK